VTLALINIGASHDGGPEGAEIPGDAIAVDGDRISWIGATDELSLAEFDEVIDVAGATVVPGFIDSHVHTTFGDYTPRQQTIGFLESYLHGGTTRVISASEVHVPGRPTSVVGVKALAVAAAHSYLHYQPSGMTVHAGSVILEPGLTIDDFRQLREQGVWLAKGGFGAFSSVMDYVPMVKAAREAGIIVMCHSGGGSIPGSMNKIDVEALLAMQPNVAGHVNGGPTALSEEENTRIVVEGGDIALQLVHAGNLRSAIDIAEKALEHDQFHRVMIATDTPTGTGMIPLGMLRQMAEMTSLGPFNAKQAISASTGNVATQYGLDAGRLRVGAPADVVVLDAPLGSMRPDAFSAMEYGDVPAVCAVVTSGVIRLTRSRNTPGPGRPVLRRK
jgi:Adenine deaminase